VTLREWVMDNAGGSGNRGYRPVVRGHQIGGCMSVIAATIIQGTQNTNGPHEGRGGSGSVIRIWELMEKLQKA